MSYGLLFRIVVFIAASTSFSIIGAIFGYFVGIIVFSPVIVVLRWYDFDINGFDAMGFGILIGVFGIIIGFFGDKTSVRLGKAFDERN